MIFKNVKKYGKERIIIIEVSDGLKDQILLKETIIKAFH